MKPQTLELEGFTGITSGSGKERVFLDLTKIPDDARLVALVGPNGAGKSTIMDNLHPFRVMPSRSTTLGPGGFSYWDNLSRPTAKKDLVWEHAGRRYRSTLTFKVSGKTKKADCYLFQWNDAQQDWTPFKLDDGTLSDGKSETYDRCVEGILGAPEGFFTSQFSAQNRKAISSYGATEVKALLASILELNHYRELSAKAAMVAKLLRFQLEALQDDISQSRGAEAGIEEVQRELSELTLSAESCAQAERVAQDGLDSARMALSLLEGKRASQAQVADEIRFLTDQIERAKVGAATQIAKEVEQAAQEQSRLTAEKVKAQADKAAAEASIRDSEGEMARLSYFIGMKSTIMEAAVLLPTERAKVAELDAKIEAEQAKLANLRSTNLSLQEMTRKQGELAVSGKAKKETIDQLRATASLIEQVPCRGNDMQRQCPLLAQANQANAGIGQHETVLRDMRGQYAMVAKTIEDLTRQLTDLHAVESTVRGLNQERQSASQRVEQLVTATSRAALLEEAELRLPKLAETVEQQKRVLHQCAETTKRCEATLTTHSANQQAATAAIQKRLSEEVQGLTDRLARLEKPVSDAEVDQAKANVKLATTAVESARAKIESLTQQRVALNARIEAFKTIQQKVAESVAEADRLSEEIAKWKLLEKGTGNDGLIALSIDDAGPEISMLCNSLLNDCYDGRFAVRLDTQRTTQAGNIKETFDVVVFDTHRGEEKSLGDMSGGERVWVNECLTRAIALYVGQSATADYETLFTDEADGPLDPERKRQFMAMKRSVLERGGYKREYFISQTPELWELADHKIDVTQL